MRDKNAAGCLTFSLFQFFLALVISSRVSFSFERWFNFHTKHPFYLAHPTGSAVILGICLIFAITATKRHICSKWFHVPYRIYSVMFFQATLSSSILFLPFYSAQFTDIARAVLGLSENLFATRIISSCAIFDGRYFKNYWMCGISIGSCILSRNYISTWYPS